jgi:hypothetical protein
MSLLSDPPFALGQTLGVTSATEGGNWVGCIKHFPDVDPTTGKVRSNRLKTCVAVRNTSGGALLPKRVAKFDTTTAGNAVFTEVKGYAAVTNEEFVGVVDEFLAAGGCAANDVCWVTVAGPTEVAVALSGTDVAVGDRLSCVTAVTAGATTAGRVAPSALTVGTANVGGAELGVIGRACSTGATTGTAVLAVVDTKY